MKIYEDSVDVLFFLFEVGDVRFFVNGRTEVPDVLPDPLSLFRGAVTFLFMV